MGSNTIAAYPNSKASTSGKILAFPPRAVFKPLEAKTEARNLALWCAIDFVCLAVVLVALCMVPA